MFPLTGIIAGDSIIAEWTFTLKLRSTTDYALAIFVFAFAGLKDAKGEIGSCLHFKTFKTVFAVPFLSLATRRAKIGAINVKILVPLLASGS